LASVLKIVGFSLVLVFEMLKNCGGKITIYASSSAFQERRMKSINRAAEKLARMLSLDTEIVAFERKFAPIYVYYKSEDEELVPLYCNKGEKSDAREVFTRLRNMMFVLSFHPKYSNLKRLRREIIQFS